MTITVRNIAIVKEVKKVSIEVLQHKNQTTRTMFKKFSVSSHLYRIGDKKKNVNI